MSSTPSEAFDAYGQYKWRPCRIESITPKGRNYPDGGAYVKWLDVDIYDMSKSQGGWVPMRSLRGYGDLSKHHVTGY